MTLQTDTSPTRRETQSIYRGRALLVSLLSRRLEIKEKGRRGEQAILSVDYLTLYEFAMKLKWRREQGEKREARKRKGKGKRK